MNDQNGATPDVLARVEGQKLTYSNLNDNRTRPSTSTVLEQLRGGLQNVTGGADCFTAKCPGHDDQQNSLQVKRLDGGKISVTCFAGCGARDILAPLGLHPRDLYPPKETTTKAKKQKGQIECCYDYLDADGRLVIQVVRYRNPKSFAQRRPDQDKPGGWNWSVKGITPPLYHQPDVLKAKAEGRTIYLVEGEKDADRLTDLGLCATTCAGGANKWHASYAATLSGARVVVLPDNDPAGIAAAWNRADTLQDAVIVMLPGLPEKGDVSDWLAAGGSVEELEALTALARANPPTRPVVDRPDVDPLSDLALAYILLKIAEGNLLHTMDRGWMIYNGKRWAPGEKAARRMVQKVGAVLRKLGHASTDDPEVIKAFYRAAKHAESAAGIEAILKIAATLPGIDADEIDFDADPMLLNCDNGTVEMKTGARRDHRREDYITKFCPHRYSPLATCPRWLLFLDEIFMGDQELIKWIKWLCGYSFTGSVHRHLFPILYGRGRNGKSALFRALRYVLGTEYATIIDPEDLMQQHNARHPAGIAGLRGARCAFAQETEQGRKINETMIKTLTGNDPIRTRVLYGQFFEFEPTHKIWMATNYRPRIDGTADAIWDRVRLIPFERRFLDHEQDPHLHAKLAAEAEGILAWAIEGARMDEPPVPACVIVATEEYKDESDLLAAFIDEALCEWEYSTVRKRDVYRAYQSYTNHRCENQKEFNRRLALRGFVEKHTREGSCWQGFDLRPEWKNNAA